MQSFERIVAFCSVALSLVATQGADTNPALAAPAEVESEWQAEPSSQGSESFSPTAWQPDLTEGYLLIDGDIQVPEAQWRLLQGGGRATFGTVAYWPGGVVPYDFVTSGTGAVTTTNQTIATDAMHAIAAIAGVNFRPAVSTDADRIRFQNSAFNNSPVGRQGGIQIINIVSWENQIIIVHELYHSLGFWHEQSRPDRDDSIIVNSASVCGSGASTQCQASVCQQCADPSGTFISCQFAFDPRAGALKFGAYDFDSFMHYDRTAFTCDGNDTITVKPPWNAQWQSQIGQRDHFSYFDRVTCRGLYPFANDRWVDAAWSGTQSGTFLEPWNLSFASAVSLTPTGGSLFFKSPGNYGAVGTYTKALTIDAPGGPVTLGN